MTTNNDGGPVFPVQEIFDERSGDILQYASEGMSLRDYFAAHAMNGLIASPRGPADGSAPTNTFYAKMAYVVADAMLKAREQ